MIPRINASARVSRDSDVKSMARGLRGIFRDGGIPPATPLPVRLPAGPVALRHCLTTVLPSEFLYWAGKQPLGANYRLLLLVGMFRWKFPGVKIPAA